MLDCEPANLESIIIYYTLPFSPHSTYAPLASLPIQLFPRESVVPRPTIALVNNLLEGCYTTRGTLLSTEYLIYMNEGSVQGTKAYFVKPTASCSVCCGVLVASVSPSALFMFIFSINMKCKCNLRWINPAWIIYCLKMHFQTPPAHCRNR